jgi:hypothetical protein
MPLSVGFLRFAGPRLPPTGLVTFTVGALLIRYIRTATDSSRLRMRPPGADLASIADWVPLTVGSAPRTQRGHL